MKQLDLTKELRTQLLQHTTERLEKYYENTKEYAVLPKLDFKEIVQKVKEVDFNNPIHPIKAIDQVIDGLEKYTLHSPHPKCFGLFVPRSAFPGVLADLITAVINPQLAAWFHAAYAIEVERFVLQEFGEKFGYDQEKIGGVFTSGGNEANLTGVLCALNNKYPDFAKKGLIGRNKQPIIYCSKEAHHSVVKAAKATGLGYDSVKSIPVNDHLQMNLSLLEQQIEADLKKDKAPFMVIGTAGTTGAGAIDDLVGIHEIANKHDLWFHIDGAYGGAAVLNEDLKPVVNGIDLSDSITFDAHKWISMPMGISLFISTHPQILRKTFDVNPEYLPKEQEEDLMPHPYAYSIQWSRRFMGLKLYLSLLIFGWEGFSELVGTQTKLGQYLKQKLIDNNWSVTNDTPLPIICFTDQQFQANEDFANTIVKNIVASGKSWISTYPVNGIPSIRTCISNYNTSIQEIDELIQELNDERARYLKG